MGTDNLYWKRKNRSFDRRSGNRGTPPNSFLIVCEGEKTEPNYFKAFSRLISSVKVKVEGCGMNTLSLVKRAGEISHQARKTGENYDQVWCVFDKDNNPLNCFNAAFELAGKKNIKIAYSNEAFELWYLLHFHYFNTGISRDDYIKKLSVLLNSPYEKNSLEMYQALLDKQQTAIKNAEKLLQNYAPPNPGKDNPSTNVHLLVQELNKFLPKRL
ncbi:MAG: RloB family protein [Candidatus Aminicenantes bacterium]|nr:RloB family protein [Candidatus Aminicenantes bacterium]